MGSLKLKGSFDRLRNPRKNGIVLAFFLVVAINSNLSTFAAAKVRNSFEYRMRNEKKHITRHTNKWSDNFRQNKMDKNRKNILYICNFATAIIITMSFFKRKHTDKEILNTFFGQILLVFIGASFSIILTLSVAYLMDNRRRQEDRRLSAMMVMSNIEIFSRYLEEISENMDTNDSIATWLLNKPVEDLELMPEMELDNLINQAFDLLFLAYDKSAENIFSNNIETWKNMGNVKFIDQVGQCFSAMNTLEERWNKWVTEAEGSLREIKDQPENYEGSTLPMKCIRSEKMRHTLKGIHYWRAWLSYMAATMRYHNLDNMEAIGIKEQEVMDYTNARTQGSGDQKEPDFNDFYSDPIHPDSLVTFRELDRLLDSLKGL